MNRSRFFKELARLLGEHDKVNIEVRQGELNIEIHNLKAADLIPDGSGEWVDIVNPLLNLDFDFEGTSGLLIQSRQGEDISFFKEGSQITFKFINE